MAMNPKMVDKGLTIDRQFIYTEIKVMVGSHTHILILIFLLKRLKLYIMAAKFKITLIIWPNLRTEMNTRTICTC